MSRSGGSRQDHDGLRRGLATTHTRIIRRVQRIDLNGDVGESFGPYTMGDDKAMLRHITSANVACGFHGGDPSVMRRTIGPGAPAPAPAPAPQTLKEAAG